MGVHIYLFGYIFSVESFILIHKFFHGPG